MSGIWLLISALSLSIFLVIMFFSKKNNDNAEVKIYKINFI